MKSTDHGQNKSTAANRWGSVVQIVFLCSNINLFVYAPSRPSGGSV
jgi:hypothetical protein